MMPTGALMRALAALTGLGAVFLLASAPASAHGGEGKVEIIALTRQGADVTVVAHVIYLADGHGVPDATVTVVVGESTPVVMEPGAGEGDYQATVPAAEGDVIRVTSVEPEVSTEATAPPVAAATTTTSEAATTTSTITEAPSSGAAVDERQEAAATTPTPVLTGETDDGSDGSTNVVVIVAILVVLVAAGAMVAILLANRKPPADNATSSDG